MRYVDEHFAEQERIKANRVTQVLEFRIENLRTRLEQMDDEIVHIIKRLPTAWNAKSHIGSYLCSLILANAGRSPKDALVDYYVNQMANFSPIEAAMIYSVSGKIRPDNDKELASELDQLNAVSLEFNSQFISLQSSLVSKGLLVSDGKKIEPILLPLLSEA